MRTFTIHKPTHKFFAPSGTPAVVIGQLRGATLYLNRFDSHGQLVEKTWAVGSAAYALTGYGKGIPRDADARTRESFDGAWAYVFGAEVPPALWCEKVEA